MPLENDPWSFWTPFVHVSRSSKQPDSEQVLYTVKLKASNKAAKRDRSSQPDDPLLEPYEISIGFTRFQKSRQVDINNKPYESTNKNPLDGISFDSNRAKVNIGFNHLNDNLSLISQYMDESATNDAALWGLGANRVKISEHSAERLLYGKNTYYWHHQFGFEIKPDQWTRREINRDYFVRPAAGQPAVLVTDVRNNKNPKLTLIAADGTELPDGANPHIIEFEDYPQRDFALLGIPLTF